ncbi:cytochrome P450 [Streptacidiphilus sp. PB12-B1b]|uniref:cytochrome P450 family protein n=1 Tax=Streptacidiphilus sp. PB12-B1b TaxID=2705012 RepID=UPI0015F7CEBA|nr:cytochrome P450 [Streptacidiphilus sp. PB12-B1b]QMU79575.1 cytochrome P450 [Streptacidiphilus sp. PB12-B1b]
MSPHAPTPSDTAALPSLDTAFGPDPYPRYAQLREAAPVHQVLGPDGVPIWLVTRYADARAALADPRLSLDRRNAAPGKYAGLSLPPVLDANLLNMDGADHSRLRRLVAPAFSAARMDALRDRVREVAAGLLADAARQSGPVDLVEAYAAPLSLTLLCDILGVDRAESRRFHGWTALLLAPATATRAQLQEALEGVVASLARQIAAKRAEPGADLLSALVTAHDGDDRLSADELLSLAFLLLLAGYENTISAITATVLAVVTEPGLRQRVAADPAVVPALVEEVIRHDGPVELAIRRFPVEDLEIGGVLIPAGEPVLIAVGSAHRDPDAFDDPDALSPERPRTGSGHLGFGHGPHYCLGAALARLETTTALSVLLEQHPEAVLALPREELRRRPSIRTRGLAALPVLLDPAQGEPAQDEAAQGEAAQDEPAGPAADGAGVGRA